MQCVLSHLAVQADGSMNSRSSQYYGSSPCPPACLCTPSVTADQRVCFLHIRVLPTTTGKATLVTLTHDDLTHPDTT